MVRFWILGKIKSHIEQIIPKKGCALGARPQRTPFFRGIPRLAELLHSEKESSKTIENRSIDMKKLTGMVFVAMLITLVGMVNNPIVVIAGSFAQTSPELGGDEYTVTFGSYPDDENKLDAQVYNRTTGEQVFFVAIDDVYVNHYHGYEVHNGNLYIIKEFVDASGENYTRELWLYNAGGERLLFTAQGIDFRVSPDESWIALAYPVGDNFSRTLGFLDLPGGEIFQEFNFEYVDEFLSLDLENWSADSQSFWVSFKGGPTPQAFSLVNSADWSVVDYEPGDVYIGSDYALEPNSGQLVYSDYPTFFDAVSAQAFADSGDPVSLFLYNLDSGVALKIAESVAKSFRPYWIDEITVGFNDPAGDGRAVLSYSILSGEMKSLEPVQRDVFPKVIPTGFEMPMQTLVLSDVPPILPAEFQVEAGLPAIYPYIYNTDSGFYEATLDYGSDCMGAGACNYGSMMGRLTTVDDPQGTENIPYDFGAAHRVILTKGIQGYFIESQCGASCSDAQVFWVYDGFEYMLGVKAGVKENVIALANAAIENSIP